MEFRVWNFKAEKMVKVRKLEFLGNRIRVNEDINLTLNMNDKENKSIHLMQYTGIKDKNNKKIYEGDIVNYYCDFYKEYILLKVVFSVDRFLLKGINTFSDFEKVDLLDYYKYISVIGNIYENKDLLD